MLDQAGRTPLHYAALEDDPSAVGELLDAGAGVDAADDAGFRPLHLAAQSWGVESAAELLRRGADVNVKNEFGNTPLFTAVYNSRGRGEMIQLLIQHGADPDAPNSSGQTPRGLAELIANYDVAQYLPRA